MSKELGIAIVDIDSGSDTRVLVKNVLDWEKSQRDKEKYPEKFDGRSYQDDQEFQLFPRLKELICQVN